MKINYDLIPIKAVIFCSQAALACILPFKSIFQKQLGISTTQNGIIMAIEKMISLFAPSFIGAIADKFSVYKLAMIVCAVLSIAFTLPMYFIPPIKNYAPAKVCCVDQNPICCYSIENGSIFQCKLANLNNYNVRCAENTTSISQFSSINISEGNDCNINSYFKDCSDDNTRSTEQYGLTFYLLVLLSSLIVIACVPLSSIIDATTLHMLGPERGHQFGKQRLWGAVGFGLVGLLTGYLVDVLTNVSENSEEKDYLFVFVGFAVFQSITALICLVKLKVPKQKFPSLVNGLLSLVRNARISCLLFVMFVSGFNLGTRYAFTFWYIEQLPGASQTLLGLTILLGCASEIPAFFVSGWICNNIGYDAVLAIGLVTSAVQCFLYTIITVAWPILFIEMLNAISFAVPFSAMCTYASELAPEGMTATLIGVTQGVYWGLGNMIGALVSGVLYKMYGAKRMFNINALIALSSGLIYYAIVKVLPMCTSKPNSTDKSVVEATDPMLDGTAKKDDKVEV